MRLNLQRLGAEAALLCICSTVAMAPSLAQKPNDIAMLRSEHTSYSRLRRTGTYRNQRLAFSTRFPEGAEISEFGNTVHAFMGLQGRSLRFTAVKEAVDRDFSLNKFLDTKLRTLPRTWDVVGNSRSQKEGAEEAFVTIEEQKQDGDLMRERKYLIKDHHLLFFELSYPSFLKTVYVSLISQVWGELRLER